jgi:hypothetical protein
VCRVADPVQVQVEAGDGMEEEEEVATAGYLEQEELRPQVAQEGLAAAAVPVRMPELTELSEWAEMGVLRQQITSSVQTPVVPVVMAEH